VWKTFSSIQQKVSKPPSPTLLNSTACDLFFHAYKGTKLWPSYRVFLTLASHLTKSPHSPLLHALLDTFLNMCVFVRETVCMCMCVCERERENKKDACVSWYQLTIFLNVYVYVKGWCGRWRRIDLRKETPTTFLWSRIF